MKEADRIELRKKIPVKYKLLKNARVVTALAFFLLTAVAFLDIKGVLPVSLIKAITYLQFIPSLTQFITMFSILAAGFLIVLLLTLLFGRVYCSTICPLGVMQDIFSFVSRKLGKRKKYKYSRPRNRTRYIFLAGVLVLFSIGGLFFVYILDPFSIFGRITSNIIRPAYAGLNNLVARLFESSGLYILYPEVIEVTAVSIIVFSLFMFGLIGWLSFWHGRIYCNTLCPVGTLLGIISRFSPYKIRIAQDACTNCGECSIVCKARCIDIKKKTVDFSRCVGCFNCIESCPESGINYKPPLQKRKPPLDSGSDPIRRHMLMLASTGILTMFFGRIKPAQCDTTTQPGNPTKIPEDKHFPVTPPGSISVQHFIDRCTACHLCVSACPTDVLQPSLFSYGALGFMQPTMDYTVNFCNYECTRCAEVCPSGAILPLETKKKKTTQIGKVHFIKENCIVFTDNTACGSCSEHCPTQAVHMVPYKESITIPEIDQSICIGCGACEYACPTRPYRAIYVDGNAVHAVANPPQIEKLEVKSTDEFPF